MMMSRSEILIPSVYTTMCMRACMRVRTERDVCTENSRKTVTVAEVKENWNWSPMSMLWIGEV